jgi:hypothetical protein
MRVGWTTFTVGLLAAALGAAACAGPTAEARRVTDTSRRVSLRGFSVLPPHGPDWFEVPAMTAEINRIGATYGLVFMKGYRRQPPATPVEAQAVLAMVIATAVGPAPPEALLDDAISRRRAGVGHGRFGPGALDAVAERWAGASCRRYEFSLEDHGHPRFPASVFVLSGRGRLCAHPHDAGLVVDAHVTQRTLRGLAPAPVSAEVQPFLDSLAFTTVR